MPKKSKKYIIFKLALVLAMPLAAGFFTFNVLYPKTTANSNLSTKTKNESGGIIKPQENKGFLSFLASSFGSKNGAPNTTGNPQEPDNTDVSLLNLGAVLNSLSNGQKTEKAFPDSLNDQIASGQQINSNNSASPESLKEPALSLYRYFITSSAIGFEQEDISSAVLLATKGNSENLKTTIAGYEGRLDAFRQLTPPALAIAVHEQSASLIENYIFLLKKMADANGEEAKKIWLSEERQNINTEANKIIVEIEELEQRYNFRLPSDVLPN